MPTPSSNPPPELPPRSHSSSCPDDIRSSAAAANTSWRPDHDGLAAAPVVVDGSGDDTVMNTPDPVGAPPPPDSAEHDADQSRSATDSPAPLSHEHDDQHEHEHEHEHDEHEHERAGTPFSSSSIVTPAGGRSPSHKPSDLGGSGPLGAGNAPATSSSSTPQQQQQQQQPPPPHGNANYDTRSTTTTTTTGCADDEAGGAAPNGRIRYDRYAPSMGFDCSSVRIIPTSPSSFLRPGSRFHGTQQSERQVYDVQVEVKYIDLRESFLCGYLKIQGLTEDNPTLTTYFEGEIIGSKYGFITKHDNWGANDKIDLNHWGKFSAFQKYAKHVRKGHVSFPNPGQKESIFMRWKEHFLVPDHRVTTINGASFEGFYYICFNQREGSISGIYFHSKSEKFQQLELKHVEDRGCFGAMEFR